MAYEIHIERSSGPIDLGDWSDAINSIDGARINSSGAMATNPVTGEVISIAGNPGDAEILFGSNWEPCLRFYGGRASFRATEDMELLDNPVRMVASKLAKKLLAEIVGDEGEVYPW
jgi:hypothetical protein